MNHTLQEELKKIYEAPAPLRKAEFLRSIEPASFRYTGLFPVQARYIRKRIWCISALIFLVSLFGSLVLSADMLWMISALMPLLALTTAAEMERSDHYRMAELEMAARFSLKSVILMRLAILGLSNLLLFGILFPISLRNSQMPPLQAGFYILTPFLLTTFLCLYIVRRRREADGIYLCAGISACIGLFLYPLRLTVPWLYEESSLGIWIFASAALCIGVIKQYQNLITQEELTWNLS